MPIAYVDTSLRDGAVGPDFEKKFAEEISRVLNKPIERIRVILRNGQRIFYNGDGKEPSCVIQIYSIGVFGEDKNPKYTQEFLSFLSSELKLEPHKITLLYHPIEAFMAGSGTH